MCVCALTRERPHRLYYDLIFVAVLAQVSHNIRLQATMSYNFFLEVLALLNLWFLSTFYEDRFSSDDGLHKLGESELCVAIVLCSADMTAHAR